MNGGSRGGFAGGVGVINRCKYWDCGQPIRPGHFLCYDHFAALQDGFLDQCPRCGRYKDANYELCLECYHGGQVIRKSPQQTTRTPQRYEMEHSSAWEAGDSEANEFYVYVLKLDGGDFYVGQTRDLRARLSEHRDNKVPSTAGRNPRLQFFNVGPTREWATDIEAQLKRLNDTNPREIRRMIIHFKDLCRELDLD